MRDYFNLSGKVAIVTGAMRKIIYHYSNRMMNLTILLLIICQFILIQRKILTQIIIVIGIITINESHNKRDAWQRRLLWPGCWTNEIML